MNRYDEVDQIIRMAHRMVQTLHNGALRAAHFLRQLGWPLEVALDVILTAPRRRASDGLQLAHA